MKVYCTICSSSKYENSELLPAISRYKSERIKSIYEKSLEDGVNFRILSGKYGLLRADDLIPWYDKQLDLKHASHLIKLVSQSLMNDNISKITYFAKNNADWQPYNLVIKESCERTRVELEVKLLDP